MRGNRTWLPIDFGCSYGQLDFVRSRLRRIALARNQLHELADLSDIDARWWSVAIAAGLLWPKQRTDKQRTDGRVA